MIIPIGIDVAKNKLDIYKNGEFFVCENNPTAIHELFSKWAPTGCRVVLEATGKYHRLAHDILHDMGFAVMVINPYQSRHFAKAMNVLCKTDRVDAKILSLFAEHMQFTPTIPLRDVHLEIQEIWRHLADLQKNLLQMEARLKESSGVVYESLEKVIAVLKDEINGSKVTLRTICKSNQSLQEKIKLLKSIPGIGETSAVALVCGLRELGELSKNQISALAGLAPINNESGTKKGKRRIKGGRYDIRAQLYMPIVGASTMHNKRLMEFYQKLIENKKPPMVALTACMRKMIVWANAVLQTGIPWEENHV